ncbi:MAG: hypothetical protein HC811_11585 [Flammeovirgaceae bacterium]|nr:hypothetical protein [Flammeovirgaceae bacterium]
MSNRSRSIIRGVAVFIVLIAVLMELGILETPVTESFKFWLAVIAIGLLLFSTKRDK